MQNPLPPAPISTVSTNYSSEIEELKSWLLASLIIELNFDESKIAEVEQRLNNCTDMQIRVLVQLYKDRIAKRDQAEAVRKQYFEQSILNQAKLDLQQAQAYRNHLGRELQLSIVQKNMETNLVRQNILNQMRFNNGGGYGYYGGFNGKRRW